MELAACFAATSGYVASLASNVLASIGSACAQALQEAIPAFQLNLSRYVFQVMICSSLTFCKRESFLVETHLVHWVVLAGLCSNLFNISYYTASALLPLGTLLVLTNITQIANSAVLNKVIFNKGVGPLKLFFIGLMVVGLVFILQPEFIFNGVSIGSFSPLKTEIELATNLTDIEIINVKERPNGVSKQLLGYLFAVGAGLASTTRGAIYKAKLPSLSMGPLGFWVGLVGVVPSGILMMYMEEPNVHLQASQGLLLFGHGFSAASYATFNIYSQRKLSPVMWAMLDNSKLILNFMLQYTLLRSIQPGNMNILEVVGALVATTAIIGAVLVDMKVKKVENQE